MLPFFHSLFNGTGRATKEVKKVFDAVSKRERTIRLLFNDEPLSGTRIIASLDNWWNLLLEECECSVNPAACSSYFSTNDIIAQIESGSFHCSLPKVLGNKREREVLFTHLKDEEKGGKGSKNLKK